MRALVDHRDQAGKGRDIGHALLFLALAFTGWAGGWALSPPPGDRGDGS
jgi:hypothetical protein